MKRPKSEEGDSPIDVLSLGFLDPLAPEILPPATAAVTAAPILMPAPISVPPLDYEGLGVGNSVSFSGIS